MCGPGEAGTLPSKDTIIGIAGALALVGAMTGVFYYESSNAPAALEPGSGITLPEALALDAAHTGCDYIGVDVPVEPAKVQDRIPADVELALNGEGQAVVTLGGLTCAESTIDNATVKDEAHEGFLMVYVTPKADALKSGQDVHLFFLDYFMVDDAYGAAHAKLGAVRTLTNSIRTEVAPTGGHLYVETAEGMHHILVPAVPHLPSQVVEGYTGRAIGYAEGGYWLADFRVEFGTFVAMAPGTFETPEGSIAREVLGASGQGMVILAPGFAMPEDTLRFIPLPAA